MKTGVAMYGCGVTGCAHAGALAALQKHGIAPDVVAGGGMGAVVAALFAAGLDPDRMLPVVHRLESSLRGPRFARRLIEALTRRGDMERQLRAVFLGLGPATLRDICAKGRAGLIITAVEAQSKKRVLMSGDASVCTYEQAAGLPVYSLLAAACGERARTAMRRTHGLPALGCDHGGAAPVQPVKMMGARRVLALTGEPSDGGPCNDCGADVCVTLPRGLTGKAAYEAGARAVDAALINICEGLYFKKTSR